MNRHLFVRNVICLLLSAMLLLIFGGCEASNAITETPPEPIVVYDDSVYIVKVITCTSSQQEDGTIRTDTLLEITNNSLESLIISSVLGIDVTCTTAQCKLMTAGELTPIDGLVKVGERAEGYISIITSVQPDSFTIKMAVDHLDDQWISFDIPVSR